MRLDFESNIASLPFAENGLSEDSAHVSVQTKELLREGVKAAQAGNRLTARTLLMRVTEIEPSNENAWLWLASISEYPEELVVFLKNVLEINPHNERALEWMAATKTLLAKTFVQRGVDAANENRLDFAKQCFEQALAQDSQNEMAWLWLASVADTEAEKRSRLEHLLTINPANEAALKALKSLQNQASQQLLQTANRFAADGNYAKASETLAEVIEKSPDLADAWLLKAHLTDSFDEKIKCFKHVIDINPEHHAAKTALNSLQTLMEFTAPSINFEQVETPATEIKYEAAAEPVSDAENFAEENSAEEVPAMDLSGESNAAEESFSELETPFETSPAETEDFYAADSAQEAEAFQPAEFSDEVEQTPETAEFAAETNFYDAPEAQTNELETAAVGEDQASGESRAANIHEDANPANYESDFSQMSAEEFAAAQRDESETVTGETEFTFEQAQNAESNFVEPQPAPEQFETAKTDGNDFQQTAENFAVAEDLQTEETVEVQQQENSESAFFHLPENQETHEYYEADKSEETALFAETSESFEQPAPESADETAAFDAPEPAVEMSECPFCETSNEAQAFACRECRATVSMSDLEMLLGNENVDKLRLQQVVSRMEMDKSVREFSADELRNLALAHFNLKNLRQGFALLQEVFQVNPNDVLLASQVNVLAIRLAEINQKEADEDAKSKGKTILVIDDSATVRKLISGKLEKSGHEVVCAVDGMDALAKLNEIVPDLILLDITMPRMDGYQVCKLIRNSETTKNIPVVMISGKDGFFDKVRGRMAGTTGYITKPFGPETLMKALEVYMDNGTSGSH